jgi:hypothetical protein
MGTIMHFGAGPDIGLSGRDPDPFASQRSRAGNTILAVGDYARASGGTAEAVAVAFTSDQTNTRRVNLHIEQKTCELTTHRGFMGRSKIRMKAAA